jgi:hypothetical protein
MHLLADPDRRAAMGASGRAWVTERFDQSVVWEALAAVIEPGGGTDEEAAS